MKNIYTKSRKGSPTGSHSVFVQPLPHLVGCSREWLWKLDTSDNKLHDNDDRGHKSQVISERRSVDQDQGGIIILLIIMACMSCSFHRIHSFNGLFSTCRNNNRSCMSLALPIQGFAQKSHNIRLGNMYGYLYTYTYKSTFPFSKSKLASNLFTLVIFV